MESRTIPAKRPRVDIIPHTAETPPHLAVGAHVYEIDEMTAVYFTKVLMDYLWRTLHRDKTPSFALKGDE